MYNIDYTKLETVTSHKLFLDSKFEQIDESGLFSERIFGPVKNYRCKCGRLNSKKLYGGQRCDKCQVLCGNSNLRYTTFAKIISPFPLLKSTKKSIGTMQKIIPTKQRYLLKTKEADLASREKNYLQHDPNTDKLKIVKNYDPANCIPLTITGGYTLYLAIYCAWEIFSSNLAKEIIDDYYTYEVLVLPPATRYMMPIAKGSQKRMSKNKLNESYSSLIKLVQYDWREITDPFEIRETFVKMIKNTVGSPMPIVNDDLQHYDGDICKHQYYFNEIHSLIGDMISGKYGSIRGEFISNTLDFSARAHITVNPALHAYEIKVPKHSFVTLWFRIFKIFIQREKH